MGSCCCVIPRSGRDASRTSPSSRWTATNWSESRRPDVFDRLAFAIASVGGAGRCPVAPGTVGSLVTLVALWLIPFNQPALLGTLIAVTALGMWAGSRVERVLGTKDPGVIVIDEVAGMLLSVLTLPRTIPVLLTAFVLFRLFDIWKPFPARESQLLTGGLGVMLDDLIAGVYALILVMAARALFGLPR
ncbi:MAG: phosphatidylglycerophosphatase A [Candidatus Rokuibacteriota bacterium]|nr:MAG: phosphatidylglycerophosphatase A [Candidatus Rokubacteria bacterium]